MHTSVNLRSAAIKSVAGTASVAGDGFLSARQLSRCSRDDLKGDSPLAKFSSQVPPRGRRIKFTPERIQQIRNLVERGKSREEIAELIEVTVGSLQVTCSRQAPVNPSHQWQRRTNVWREVTSPRMGPVHGKPITT
jgi:DNA-binding NarL/FixJ family response regulator